MFLENKYTRWYYQLIENANKRDYTKIGMFDKHHIIPKSFGGSNDEKNLVKLTPREHYLAHLLLIKMTKGLYKQKMAFALFRFSPKNTKNRFENSHKYEYFRKVLAKGMTGKNNPFYGKHHTEESKNKIRGENHGLYGKGLYINWVEKYGIEEADKRNESYKRNLSRALMGRTPAMSTLGKMAVYKNDGNKKIRKMVWPDEVQEMIKSGWILYEHQKCPGCNGKIKRGAKNCCLACIRRKREDFLRTEKA